MGGRGALRGLRRDRPPKGGVAGHHRERFEHGSSLAVGTGTAPLEVGRDLLERALGPGLLDVGYPPGHRSGQLGDRRTELHDRGDDDAGADPGALEHRTGGGWGGHPHASASSSVASSSAIAVTAASAPSPSALKVTVSP